MIRQKGTEEETTQCKFGSMGEANAQGTELPFVVQNKNQILKYLYVNIAT